MVVRMMVDQERRVALTFDTEHPDRRYEPGVAEALLDTLSAAGVSATFLIQGRWAEANPQTAMRIARDGHLIGSHSHYHVRMPLLNDAGLADDIHHAEKAIRDATGVDPRPWFRCPWGAHDTRVLASLATSGYRHVGWDVDSRDWDPSRTAALLPHEVVSGVLARGETDAVVLLHSWPSATRDALDPMIRRLLDAGARIVRLDAMTRVPE